MKTPQDKMRSIFKDDPQRGAEYCGEIATVSVWFGEATEAFARAGLAAEFARLSRRPGKAGIASGAALARKAKGKA